MCVGDRQTDRQRQRETERELENFNTSRIIALGPNSQSLLYYKHRLAQLYYKHIIMNTNKQYINERERGSERSWKTEIRVHTESESIQSHIPTCSKFRIETLDSLLVQKLGRVHSQKPYKAIFRPAPSSEARPFDSLLVQKFDTVYSQKPHKAILRPAPGSESRPFDSST